MAISKAQKAILKAKYGDKVYELLIKAENVLVGEDETLADKLTELVGSDSGKSIRVIAGEVLAAAGKLERKKVDKLADIKPEEADADKYIYMVPKTTSKNGDKYDEYMVIDDAVEKVGDWEVDLADYIQKVSGATAGDVAVLKADGTIEDTGIKASDITAAKTVTDKLAENADAIGGITAAKIAAWDGKTKLHVGTTQPQDMQNGDIWLQTFEG